MKLIDTHFHLDFYRDHKFWYDRINELEQYTLCVTNSPEIYHSCKRLYPETKYVKFALGYNPQVSANTPFNKRLFLSQLGSTKYLGEVGLDYSAKNVNSKAIQIEAFDFICQNAASHNKILSVHSRMAEKETLQHSNQAVRKLSRRNAFLFALYLAQLLSRVHCLIINRQ